MKKVWLIVLVAVIGFSFVGCAGSAKPAEKSTAGSGGITLDQALKETAVRIDEVFSVLNTVRWTGK
ncbi:MAG: hypothetical protein LBI04_09130 [Treponema sp.]|nr:hypothetical protein [Treponema sp.]